MGTLGSEIHENFAHPVIQFRWLMLLWFLLLLLFHLLGQQNAACFKYVACRVVDISRPGSDLSAYRPHSQIRLPSPRECSSAYERRRRFQHNVDRSVQYQHAVFHTGSDAFGQCQQQRRFQFAVVIPRLSV